MLAYFIDGAAAPAERFSRRVVFDVSPEDVKFAEELMTRNARMSSTFHGVREPLELGIAEATVETHLAAVMKKLGATSRIELIRCLE